MKFRAILIGFSGLLAAQQTPVLQTETREVLVDAIVTAKNGVHVSDLTAKDFHISQDGKEQAIKSFTLESGASNSQTRSLVLFFDETSMEPRDQVAVRQAAANFVDAEAGPNHRMAVVIFNGSMRIAQSFTDNAGRLKDALNQASFRGLAASAADSDRSHDPSRQEEDRLVGRGGTGLVNAFGTRGMVRSLADLARSLGVLPGRKIVISFTGALAASSDPRAEIRDAVDAANRSGVAFYAVDVRPVLSQADPGNQPTPQNRPASGMGRGGAAGLGAQDNPDVLGPAVSDSGSNSQQILFNLANGTGGFVVTNTADLLGGLQNIGQEQDQYYVLTYAAPETKEGSCHTLKVKVDRKQTTVRARTVYCADKPLDLLAGTTAAKELEQRAAATQAGGMRASMEPSYFYVGPSVARVDVAMEIEAGALKFENRKGKPHAELNFLGIATGSDSDVHARFSDTLKMDFDNPSQVENLQGKSFHYEKEFKIAPGQYNLTVTFGQNAGQNNAGFGKVQAPLVVDPWAGDLALSGLALSREAHPAADLGLAPALEGRTPLVAEGIQIVPTGSYQFAKAQPAFVYLEAYGSEAAGARIRMRILDAKSGEQRWEGGSMNLPAGAKGAASVSAVSAGARLPTDALAPGAYRLEVTATGASGKEMKRTADFGIY